MTKSNGRYIVSRQELSLKALRMPGGAFDYCIRYVGRYFARRRVCRSVDLLLARRRVSNICLRLSQVPVDRRQHLLQRATISVESMRSVGANAHEARRVTSIERNSAVIRAARMCDGSAQRSVAPPLISTKASRFRRINIAFSAVGHRPQDGALVHTCGRPVTPNWVAQIRHENGGGQLWCFLRCLDSIVGMKIN
jgi:hypothetical protein